jgi:hypothetical protein
MYEILQGLYDSFIGRDLFAKIGPGFILLGTLAWYLDSIPPSLSVEGWLFVFVLSWITGLSVQSIAELEICCGPWLRYFPKGTKSEAWHDKVGKMMELPDYTKKCRAPYERLIVIKEACGIASLALFLSAILFAFRKGFDYFQMGTNPDWRLFPIAAGAILLIYALWRMSRRHAERQSDYVRRVLERNLNYGDSALIDPRLQAR